MAAETLEEVIKQRDKALARASEQAGFRRYWKDKADTMIRKFDAAQAHAWELEQKVEALEAAQQPRPLSDIAAVPEPGTLVYAVAVGSVPLHCGNDVANWCVDEITHWLTLPAREDSPDNPEIGASGKTE